MANPDDPRPGGATDPDPLDALRELSMETQEQDDPEDSSGKLALSALAMLAAAAALSPVAWWLWRAGQAARADARAVSHSPHSSEQDVSTFLFFIAVGAMFAITVLVIFGLISLGKIIQRRLGP